MKKNFIIANILLLASCGSMYRQPETIQEKMSRFKSRDIKVNPVPKFHVTEFTPTRGRFPASATSTDMNYNNKSIYFLSLYEQYEAFSAMYPQYKAPIKHCPVFHQPLLSYKESAKKWQWDKKSNNMIKSASMTKSLVSSSKSKNYPEAIREHMDRNHSEIIQLCESGSSDNYYVFENLITISNDKKRVKRDHSGLNSYLKTTLFYNETLLHTVGNKKKARSAGRSLASNKKKHDFTNEALNRIKASWAKSYYLNR